MASATRIGRYVIYDAIASGGMASIHLGRLVGPVGFSRTVAIKRLHRHLAGDPEFVAMFLDEARLAARIQHPNVVGTVDVVSESDELFLVMQYIHGDSLAHLAKQSGRAGQPVPVRIAAAIVTGALNGLHAAHEATSENGEPLGIVHRDVSPQNVLVGVDGVPRVLDFGIAKAASRVQTTEDGRVKGKLAYMAREQLQRRPLDRRTDLYAMGVALWELLAGQRLFEAEDAPAVIAAVLEGHVPELSKLRADVPRELDDVLRRALHAEPSARFATAIDFAEAIEHVLPVAPQRDVGAWVTSLAGEQLAERKKLVALIEGTPVDAGDIPSFEQRRRLVEAPTDILGTSEPHSQITNLSATTNASPRKRALPWAALILAAGAAVAIPLALRSHKDSQATPATASIDRPAPPPSASAIASVSAAPSSPAAPSVFRAPVPIAPAPTHTARRPRSTCDPPFIIDAAGVKRFKPQCL
ncbi:MAG TPA: serine/threonine-protein kinase [Polyangiaceae bacterium]